MTGRGDIPNPETWLQGPYLSGYIDPVALHQIDLFWTAPKKPYPATGTPTYSVYRGLNGATPTLLVSGLLPTQLSYQDTTVVAGLNTYTYYVVVSFGGVPALPSNRLSFLGAITDVFLASGTWAKRQSMKYAAAAVIGGGSAGMNSWAAVTQDVGGFSGTGGGAGGGYALAYFLAADLTATVAVTVGAGSAGPTGATYSGSSVFLNTILNPAIDGNPSPLASTSSFGTQVVCTGGGTQNGTNPIHAIGGTATVVGGYNVVTETGGQGGLYVLTGVDNPRPGADTTSAPAGGGGAATWNAENSATASAVTNPGGNVTNGDTGGAGGAAVSLDNGSTGTVNGNPGAPGAAPAISTAIEAKNVIGGSGGGGSGMGYSSNSTLGGFPTGVGYKGGNGGFPGGGGGSGSPGQAHAAGSPGCSATLVCGAGGDGGNGVVVVTSYFW